MPFWRLDCVRIISQAWPNGPHHCERRPRQPPLDRPQRSQTPRRRPSLHILQRGQRAPFFFLKKNENHHLCGPDLSPNNRKALARGGGVLGRAARGGGRQGPCAALFMAQAAGRRHAPAHYHARRAGPRPNFSSGRFFFKFSLVSDCGSARKLAPLITPLPHLAGPPSNRPRPGPRRAPQSPGWRTRVCARAPLLRECPRRRLPQPPAQAPAMPRPLALLLGLVLVGTVPMAAGVAVRTAVLPRAVPPMQAQTGELGAGACIKRPGCLGGDAGPRGEPQP